MAALEDRLEAGLPEAWRPDKEDPDILIGEVVELQWGTSEYGSYPIVVVRKEDGSEQTFHAFHTVAQNELARQKPQVGERIGIKYLGEQKTKPGSKYKSFIGHRIKVERAAGQFDWAKIGGEPDPEFAAPDEPPVEKPANAGDDDIPF